MTMRILKIVGDIDVNLNLPEDTKVESVKIHDYLVTEYEQQFDMIFCVHVLQTLWAAQVGDAVAKLVGDLKPGGELQIHVPATEHAAKAILRDQTDPIAFYLIWGAENRPFHCGFTLMWLRAEVEQAGAIVRNANVGLFNMRFNEQEVKAPEHVVLATVIRD